MLRAGARCARPDCGRATVGPSQVRPDKGQVLGVAAHICGASQGGPRYDASQTDDERHSAENGIWLCEYCAALVDKVGGTDFSVDDLKLWKRASERAALEGLLRHSDVVRDNCVRSLIYINVPRLQHYVALTDQPVRVPTDFDEGIPGDGYIAPELLKIRRAIERMRFPALDWVEGTNSVEDPTGMLVSFEGLFRTKNGPQGRHDRRDRDLTNLKVAPHIYRKSDATRLVLPYDPRFVTTSTAMVELTRGQIRVGGFAQVKYRNGGDVIASPFIIGLASTPEVRAFWDAFNARGA